MENANKYLQTGLGYSILSLTVRGWPEPVEPKAEGVTMLYTYIVKYTDGRTGSTKDKVQEIQAVNFTTAIAKAAVMAMNDNAVETHITLCISNKNNSDLLFDFGNESTTIELENL